MSRSNTTVNLEALRLAVSEGRPVSKEEARESLEARAKAATEKMFEARMTGRRCTFTGMDAFIEKRLAFGVRCAVGEMRAR